MTLNPFIRLVLVAVVVIAALKLLGVYCFSLVTGKPVIFATILLYTAIVFIFDRLAAIVLRRL